MTTNTARPFNPIPIPVLGLSLAAFLTITFVVCVVFDLLFPAHAMYPAWEKLLPGFTWISWSSFFLGGIETFAYGWYAAFVFGPIYNFLGRRLQTG